MDVQDLVGRTVVSRKPSGRRQRLTVDRVEDLGDGVVVLLGRIPSRKFPGDFIGYGHAYLARVEEVE